MATFFNRATLSYNNGSIESNTVTGELLRVLSAAKRALESGYEPNDPVTYIINIVNTGTTAFTGLTVTDDLGAYEFGTSVLVPLTYIDGSIQYYVNGVLQPDPMVDVNTELIISGITVPAGGNVTLIYQARVNEFAPLGEDAVITNTAVVSGETLSSDIVISATIPNISDPSLTISKSISPEVVTENEELTYTFVIQNSGSTPATGADNIVVTDLFSPILGSITVTFNGMTWTEPANYTYDETTGLFQTVAGQITVPAATFTQDETTGEWTIVPGVAVLRVTGTI